MSNRRILVVGLVLLAAGLIGMTVQTSVGGWWGMPMGPMMGWWQPADTNIQQPAPIAGAPTVEVEATEFAFQPDQVVVDADETVNLTLVNNGSLTHDLTIPELDIHLVARPGQTNSTALSPTDPGEYQMLCTIPGHAEAGMVGLIVIRAP